MPDEPPKQAASQCRIVIAVNVLAQFSMAGFEVTLHGRSWVTPEATSKSLMVELRPASFSKLALQLHRQVTSIRR